MRAHGLYTRDCFSVLLHYYLSVLLSPCPTATVLVSHHTTVLLSFCLSVILYYYVANHTVLVSYCITVLLSYCLTHLFYVDI